MDSYVDHGEKPTEYGTVQHQGRSYALASVYVVALFAAIASYYAAQPQYVVVRSRMQQFAL